MIIMVYLLTGVLMLGIYTAIVYRKIYGMSIKRLIMSALHPLIFVVFWPIDLFWCLYPLQKQPTEFKEGMENSMKELL